MKQSSEALRKAQDQAMARKALLEAGRIRVDPPAPKTTQPQQEESLENKK